MNPKAARLILAVGMVVCSLLISDAVWAQETGAAVSGKITATSGAVIPNAKISVKSVATGQTREAQSDADGAYSVSGLFPGDYEVSVSAEGYQTKTAKVTLRPGATQTIDLALSAGISLGELGFPPAETQGNAQEQARLDKRTHMLKIHQRLGLITTAPLLATVISGSFAGGKSTSSSTRDLHAALGSVTAGMYITTASYAIFAPKIPGTKTRGHIRLHKALAWVHGPGMILTPILGALAFQQKSNGERVHGIARAHGPVGYVTVGAYVAALLSVSF